MWCDGLTTELWETGCGETYYLGSVVSYACKFGPVCDRVEETGGEEPDGLNNTVGTTVLNSTTWGDGGDSILWVDGWLIVFAEFFWKSLYTGWSRVYCQPISKIFVEAVNHFNCFITDEDGIQESWGTHYCCLCFPDLEIKVVALTSLCEACNSVVIFQNRRVIFKKRMAVLPEYLRKVVVGKELVQSLVYSL